MAPNSRYFFSLWPDKHMAQCLMRHADELLTNHGCLRSQEQNLHLTLTYLGHIEPDKLLSIVRMISTVQIHPFSLEINHSNYWSHSKVCWLGLKETPPELIMLVDSINTVITEVGINVEHSQFIPHVTLARKCNTALPAQLFKSIYWKTRSFCLVKSSGSKGLSKYEIIQEWPLR